MRYTVELGCKDSKQYFGSALANLSVTIAVCSSTEEWHKVNKKRPVSYQFASLAEEKLCICLSEKDL